MVELEQATTGERREANRTALAKATAAESDLEQQIQTLQSSIDSDKVNLAEAEQLGIEQWEERLQKHEELRRVLNEVRIYLQSHLPTVRSHLARANVLLHEFGIGELSDLSYNDFALIDRYLTEVDRLIKPIVAGLQGAQTAPRAGRPMFDDMPSFWSAFARRRKPLRRWMSSARRYKSSRLNCRRGCRRETPR